MSGPVDSGEKIAHIILALVFLALACLEGATRLLRVIDSRRRIIIQRTTQYFATQNYSTSNSHLGSLNKANSSFQTLQRRSPSMGSGANTQSNQTSGLSTSNLSSSSISPQNQQQQQNQNQQQQSSSSSSNKIPSLASDNRFLLGLVSVLVGVGRSAYCFTVLLFTSTLEEESTIEKKMTSSGETTDLITLPLAALTYCLVIAVLYAHRELMTKIKKAAASQQQQQQQQQNENEEVQIGQQQEEESNCCQQNCFVTFFNEYILPFRSLATMLFISVIMIISFVIETATNKAVSEITSPVISFVLGIFACAAAYESYTTLTIPSKASTRVIVAISILAIYLIARGVIFISPVQQKLCVSGSYFRCFFLFSAYDAFFLLLSVLVLP